MRNKNKNKSQDDAIRKILSKKVSLRTVEEKKYLISCKVGKHRAENKSCLKWKEKVNATSRETM